MPTRLAVLCTAALAASAAFLADASLALADGCARSSHASTGVMGGPASSFVEIAAPALCVGLITWAVRRAKK